MLGFVPSSERRTLRLLCVGAHCDDIEIGCGATLRTLARERPRLAVDWFVLSGTEARRRETRRAMARLVPAAQRGTLRFGDFADARFPAQYAAIKDAFESVKRAVPYDLVFCHERDDRHQDHRIVNEMCWSTFRDHAVFEYEIPKWDGGLGQPNCYVPVSARDAEAKVATLLASHVSQAGRDWFTRETFFALLRLRGVECRSPSGYAEAFHARKLVLHGH